MKIFSFFENESILLEDINNFINLTYGKYFEKTTNKFIIGESFGSLLAILASLNKNKFFDGVIILSPPKSLNINENSLKYKMLKFLNKLYPSYCVSIEEGKLFIK